MPNQETGKQRAARIPLDYFKKPGPLERVKRALTGVAALGVIGWWGSGMLRPHREAMRYSRGPVAAAHAVWDAQCDACHVPFRRIGAASWSGAGRCETCHAGPPHHAAERPGDTPSCAQCHREHRGRDASLVRIADADCLACHDHLAAHTQPEARPPGAEFASHVGRFDRDHPDFKIPRESPGTDPGKLHFNHARHMAPGMVLTNDGSVLTNDGSSFTLADIPAAERERYRGRGASGAATPDSAAVQLSCAACHQLDNAHASEAAEHAASRPQPARPRGAYMLPIRYDEHCRACHPLTFDTELAGRTVPHPLAPDAVQDFLENTYAAQYLLEHPESLDRPAATRTMPGPSSEQQNKARDAIERKVATAGRLLFLGQTTCAECHAFERQAGAVVPEQVLPTDVPTVWYRHATFDHAAHRAVSCRDCHGGAYPDSPQASVKSSDVLLPGIAVCRRCHAPAQALASDRGGGAGFACTECHRYHNGDHPLEGLGAPRRGAAVELNIEQFLSAPAPK